MTVSSLRQPARILIVDDHPIVREGLAALLSIHPDLQVCGQAGDIATALRLVNEHAPDVAVVDISLQNESGLELVRRIKEKNKKSHTTRTLVVSMYDEALYGERAIAAGAMGYLNKQVAGRNVVAAIRQILQGKMYLSEELSERLQASHVTGNRRVGIASLSNRELDVFRLIGTGITTVQIAKSLNISIKTVESHRQNIKRKLNLTNTSELSREATCWVLENG